MKQTLLTLGFIAAAYILKAQVLYGTTFYGGNNNGGTICQLVTANNTLTAPFSFDAPDGASPEFVKLLQAFDGKLYGMTREGGSNAAGALFSYDPAASIYTKLMDFDYANGALPYGSLIQASDGKLYGMTWEGGSNDYGVIFSYDPADSAYTKLMDFDYTNGYHPHGSLVQVSDGKLYGMTSGGGSNEYGVIFSFDPATLAYTKLKNFDDVNGAYPHGDLVQASDGKLYGMTALGGSSGEGVIFSYDPATSIYTKLKDFNGNNGRRPIGSLIQASDGKLYGMTNEGGNNDVGTIFSYDPADSTYAQLIDFDRTNGRHPYGNLLQASDGKLYGMTTGGGDTDYGVIFSFDPVNSIYTKLEDFNYADGAYPFGSLVRASDGKLYGMTNSGGSSSDGVIFLFDAVTSAYKKLRDFGLNNTGNYISGPVIKDHAKKLYGMTNQGGSHGAGTIFSYDAATSVFTKLKDFNGINGGNPYGSLALASDGKLYGTTRQGGSNDVGVIFSYDAADSTYTKLVDFDGIHGANPYGSLMQASDGNFYGMTYAGGDNNYGVIFSFDPATSAYTKLINFDGINGSMPSGSIIQASDGKLYGMTTEGGSEYAGTIFSYDPATLTYTKLKDFDFTNGAFPEGSLIQASDGKLYGMTRFGGNNLWGVIFSYDLTTSSYTNLYEFSDGIWPYGSLMQASDGKLYGMTSEGVSNDYGVAFSYDISTSTYTKLSDFSGENGSYPLFTSFTEIPAGEIQISIADKSVIEGNQDRKFIAIPVNLSEKSSKKIIRVKYTTQNNTATAGSDFVAQSGTLVFLPGLKKTILPIRIKGNQIPEANETFSIILSDPVNATIADDTAIVTILDDDASTLNAAQEMAKTISAISLSPNPAQHKVKIMLTGYSGNVVLQLSSFDGRILQQQKLQAFFAKSAQHQINVSGYANGTYLITAIDEKGNRQTKRLVVDR